MELESFNALARLATWITFECSGHSKSTRRLVPLLVHDDYSQTDIRSFGGLKLCSKKGSTIILSDSFSLSSGSTLPDIRPADKAAC